MCRIMTHRNCFQIQEGNPLFEADCHAVLQWLVKKIDGPFIAWHAHIIDKGQRAIVQAAQLELLLLLAI